LAFGEEGAQLLRHVLELRRGSLDAQRKVLFEQPKFATLSGSEFVAVEFELNVGSCAGSLTPDGRFRVISTVEEIAEPRAVAR
jgi:hypothetical protein